LIDCARCGTGRCSSTRGAAGVPDGVCGAVAHQLVMDRVDGHTRMPKSCRPVV
jgi:hypothetical protein